MIEGPGIYYVGIIDILQEYNLDKKLERFAKVTFQCKSANGISCIPPIPYAERFVKKMKDIVSVCMQFSDI